MSGRTAVVDGLGLCGLGTAATALKFDEHLSGASTRAREDVEHESTPFTRFADCYKSIIADVVEAAAVSEVKSKQEVPSMSALVGGKNRPYADGE